MNKTTSLFFFLFLFAGLTSCLKEEADPDVIIKNSIPLTGSQEVPAVPTNGTGELHLQYRKSSRTLTYNITWEGLSSAPAAIYFHGPASPGQNANPVLPVTDFAEATSGSKAGSVEIEEGKVNDFLGGKWYVNIQTANYRRGEVRGQIQL